MNEWIRSALDLLLILMIAAGLVQATRLIRHLIGLRQGRIDMERFVHEFNAVVVRAEMGIKSLKQAARDSGDDLEQLVEKATMIRDELKFIVESGDQLAERITSAASTVVRPAPTPVSKPEVKTEVVPTAMEPQAAVTPLAGRRTETPPSSRAEKELLQALQKLK